MSEFCAEFINSIPGVEDLSYLELGHGEGRNFDKVKCLKKVSVDTNGKATYKITTSGFFNTCRDEFDIIFVDANHDYEKARKDVLNSSVRCRKYLFIHDLVPPDKEHTQRHLCSDSYKILFQMRAQGCRVFTLDGDCGLSVLPMSQKITLLPDLDFLYEQFLDFMQTVPLLTIGQFKTIFTEKKENRNGVESSNS